MQNFMFEVLQGKKDLTQYQERTADKVGVRLPMDYLKKGKVLGLVNIHTGDVHGGFTLTHEGSLRCLEQLPQEVWDNNEYIQKYANSCFEINGLWLDKKVVPKESRFYLYLHCMNEAINLSFLGKSKYVYAYCAENPKLKEFYKNFNSFEIYEGPVRKMPGMEKESRERVEMGCIKRLPWNIARNPGFLLERAVGQPFKFLFSPAQSFNNWKRRKA